MALDVAVPEPPDLTNRGMPRECEGREETLGAEDLYREDIDELLQDGAWQGGFTERTEDTDLDEVPVRIVSDLGPCRAFDVCWDPTDDPIRVDTPAIPNDWRERDATDSFDSSTVSTIDAELEALGRAVQETLENHLERDEEASDYGGGKETAGHRRECPATVIDDRP